MSYSVQKAMNGIVSMQGIKVQVYTSEMDIDPNFYMVESYAKDIVTLRQFHECNGGGSCNKCNGRIRLHHTRIARIYGGDGSIIFESNDCRKEQKMGTEKQVQVMDINNIKSHGELWSKSVNFDHASYKVEAHVLIAPDHRSFRVFNTYNGTLGKNGKLSDKVYSLEDDAAYERKIDKLKKQGYKKR